MVKVGCISLIPIKSNLFLAIECAKGRGTILPGGKIQEGETYLECARRELQEETTIAKVDSQKLFFQAHSVADDYYVYAFLTTVDNPQQYVGMKTDEGTVVAATWDDLFASSFRGYYELMQPAYYREIA